MKIILVCLTNFQEYIIDNIKNLIAHNNTDIVVITEPQFFQYFKEFNIQLINKNDLNDHGFNKKSQLDRHFRNGFWHLCSLRFFYLYSYIEKNNINKCLHIENDVMIYKDLTNYEFQTDKIACTFDCYKRVIPSIIYIPTPNHFNLIISNYDNKLDDMYNLAKFDENIIERLPIYSDCSINNEFLMITKNYSKYNMIFDAAAIGQYLGGVDPRNKQGDTTGFINETTIIKYNTNKFYWIKENELYYPHIDINGQLIPIFNLHIHSKNLKNFLSIEPNENKYITIK